MIQNLTPNTRLIRVSNAVAAGTTDIDCTSVDMQGFDSVRFIALFGTATTTHQTRLVVRQSADNSTFSNPIQTGPLMADGDSNRMLIAEIAAPGERYVRVTVDRGTANIVIDGVIAELFNAARVPVVQDASVSQSAISNNPIPA
jgi:hypothetical protein